jgi:hypothetical protein
MPCSNESTFRQLPALKPLEFPGALHRSFEFELGQINVQMCALDAALLEFSERVREAPGFLKDSVWRHGHRNLAAGQLDLGRALDLSYGAAVALLLSRLDQLCSRIRRHPFIDREQSSLAKGDFLRKTLWLILASHGHSALATPLKKDVVELYLTKADITKFDSFRLRRNGRLHAGDSEDADEEEADAAWHPRFADVLDCSKTLQRLARSLCLSLSGEPLALAPTLSTRFGRLPAGRRRNAALAALIQDYLVDEARAHPVISILSW